VYFDPSANEIDQSDYVIIQVPIAIDELKKKFPKHAKQIKKVKVPERDQDNQGADDSDKSDDFHIPDSDTQTGDEGRYQDPDVTMMEEAYLKDYSLEQIPPEFTAGEIAEETEQFQDGTNPDVGKWENHADHIEAHKILKLKLAEGIIGIPGDQISVEQMEELTENEQFGLQFQMIDDHVEMHEIFMEQNPNGMRPKFPNQLRLVIKNGDTILFDGEPPVDNGMVPIIPVYGYKDDTSIYGTGEAKNIIPIQKSYNEMDWFELQGLRLNSNSGWIKDELAEVDASTLTNEPGIVVTTKTGGMVQRLPPGETSPQFEVRKQSDQTSIEFVSGVNEVSQGRKPKGITAAAAIEEMRESSNGRIRLKTRMLEEYSMPRLAEIVAAYIITFWTSERQLRTYDKNGSIQFIDFDPSDVRDLEYNVRMAPGTSSGMDKESVFKFMAELAQAGAIDVKTLIEVTDIPHKAHILEKLDQQEQEAEQQRAELASQGITEEQLLATEGQPV
jgi:hypothetical protein